MNPGPKVIGPSSPAGNSERRSERVLASTDLPQPRLGRGAPRFGYSVARHCSSASPHWTTIPLSPSFLKKLAHLTCITSKQSQLRPQSSWQQTSSAPRPLHMAARNEAQNCQDKLDDLEVSPTFKVGHSILNGVPFPTARARECFNKPFSENLVRCC